MRSHQLGAGLIAITAAAGVATLVHAHPDGLRGPAWVAYLACTAFAAAGLAAIPGAFGRPRFKQTMICVILAAMLGTGAWIAAGPGSRECVATAWQLGVASPDAVCRGAFGLGATIVALMLVQALRGLARASPGLQGTKRRQIP
ncbi:MAG: hypothetical protein H0W24_05305 [Lysobacter sp.]|nr:hypothetical protein [Lysobacter sp.]